MPFTIVQLTDCHLGSAWSRDAAASLAAVIDAVGAILPGPPDVVLVSGDVANTPAEPEYVAARSLLDRFGVPVYALPGNHDDRALLRRHFALPDSGRDDLSYAVDLGPVRLIALDSQRPGEGGGQLDRIRLEWLDRVLGEDVVTPTLLAVHHPPLLTGVPAMDRFGTPEDERRALAAIVARHPQLQLIVAGHVHRTIVGTVGGTPVLAVPSTNLQLALDLEADDFRLVEEAPCFAVHLLLDGRLVSHVQPVAPPAG